MKLPGGPTKGMRSQPARSQPSPGIRGSRVVARRLGVDQAEQGQAELRVAGLSQPLPKVYAAGDAVGIELDMNVPDRRSLAGEDRRGRRLGDDARCRGCLDYRQHHRAVQAHCTGEGLVARRVGQCRLGKQHIHRHRPGARLVQPLEQLGMYRPRPRPAADAGDAGVVDRDHHHIVVDAARTHRHGAVVDDLVDAPQPSESRCRASQQAARQQHGEPLAQRPADQWRLAGHNASNGTRPSHHGKGVAMTKRWGEV